MKSINIDYKTLVRTSKAILKVLHKNNIVAITVAGGLLGLLVANSVQSAITTPRSLETYTEELATYKAVEFDEEVIEEIVKLVENDVDIRSQLPNSRDNPFLDF